MKKMTYLILCILIAMLLVSCGEKPASEQITYDELGNKITTTDKGSDISASTLPCAIDFNGKDVYLTKVEFYEVQSESGSYTLDSLVYFDASALSENEIADLRNNRLSISAYFDSPINYIDCCSLTILGSFLYTDTKELILISTSALSVPSSCYYSFKSDEKLDFSLFVYIDQRETYSYKSPDGRTSSLNKTNELLYFPDYLDVKKAFIDIEDVDPRIQDFATQQLLNRLLRMIELGL